MTMVQKENKSEKLVFVDFFTKSDDYIQSILFTLKN